MKKYIYAFFMCFFILPGLLSAETLQQAYQNAAPGLGYGRLIILDPSTVYTGGLSIVNEKIGIKGQGAIIDLGGDAIVVSGRATIDLDACVIINGGRGLSLHGSVTTLVTNCTFYGNQIGIRCFSETGMIEVVNTILSNSSQYGFASCEEVARTLHYLDAYQNTLGDYVEWCPG